MGVLVILGRPDNPVSLAQSTSYPNKIFMPLIANTKVIYQTGPDIYTTSYYMSTIDTQVAYTRGCALGTRDAGLVNYQLNLVVLDYGKPVSVINGQSQLGTRIFSAVRVPISSIEASARSFAQGYYVCTGADTGSRLIVGIGTSNYQDDDECSFCAVNYAHGKAWAEMVNRVNAWFTTNGYASQVSAVGANDIELSWNTYARTKDWLDGYDSADQFEMLNYGALEGCPYSDNSTATYCNNGWTRSQALYVVWGSPPVWPVPEIYANNAVNARQWYQMSLYSYANLGYAMQFRGVMTQYGACQQSWDSDSGTYDDPSCVELDNTPAQGWSQLQNLLNGNAKTIFSIPYVTDIRW